MKETIKKLDTGHVEIKQEIIRYETFTVQPEQLDRDIESADAVVKLRVSELTAAEKNLADFKALKVKISKAK